MHFIMCLSKPRLSYNGKGLARGRESPPEGLPEFEWLWAAFPPTSLWECLRDVEEPDCSRRLGHQLERQPGRAGKRPRGQARVSQKSLGLLRPSAPLVPWTSG